MTGGVEMHLLTICPEMVRQGAEVSVLCGSLAGEPDAEEVEGVTVERRDGMVPQRIAEAREAGRDVYEDPKRMFGEFLDDHGIDVVQGHNLHLDFFDLSRALADACDERDVPYYIETFRQADGARRAELKGDVALFGRRFVRHRNRRAGRRRLPGPVGHTRPDRRPGPGMRTGSMDREESLNGGY